MFTTYIPAFGKRALEALEDFDGLAADIQRVDEIIPEQAEAELHHLGLEMAA